MLTWISEIPYFAKSPSYYQGFEKVIAIELPANRSLNQPEQVSLDYYFLVAESCNNQ